MWEIYTALFAGSVSCVEERAVKYRLDDGFVHPAVLCQTRRRVAAPGPKTTREGHEGEEDRGEEGGGRESTVWRTGASRGWRTPQRP